MKNAIAGTKRKYGGIKASARQEERRKKLVDAGLAAFGGTGYSKATIKQICDIAGLTERYFYESFKTKEDLLGVVYGKVVEGLLEKAEARLARDGGSSRELVMDVLEIFYGEISEDPRKARMLFFEILGVSPEIDRLYQEATMRLAHMTAKVMLKAFPVLDPELLNKSIVPVGLAGAVDLIAATWSMGGFKTPKEEILLQVDFLVATLEKFLAIDSIT